MSSRLGNSEVGTNVAEYYKSLSAFVDITSPQSGDFFLVESEILLTLSTNKLNGVNAFIDGELVATSDTNEISIKAPSTEQVFTVTLVGINQDNNDDEFSSEVTLNAVTEFMPELTVSVPDSVEQTRSFDVSVEVEHAAGYKAEFTGDVIYVTDNSVAQFIAPQTLGSYPLTITAIDENNQSLDVSETFFIDVVPLTVECSVGGETIWNSGAVYSDIKVENVGDSGLSTWTILLNFENNVQF